MDKIALVYGKGKLKTNSIKMTCQACLTKTMVPSVCKIVNELTMSGVDQRSSKWMEMRNSGSIITASRVPSLLHESFFQSRSDLLSEMTYPTKSQPPTAAMTHGVVNEPKGLELYCKFTGHRLIEPNPGIALNPNILNGKLGGSPDGITYCGILVEVKCPLTRKIGWVVPKCYKSQIQCMLHVMELDMAHFFQYDATNAKCTLTNVKIDEKWLITNEKSILQFLDELDTCKRISKLQILCGDIVISNVNVDTATEKMEKDE